MPKTTEELGFNGGFNYDYKGTDKDSLGAIFQVSGAPSGFQWAIKKEDQDVTVLPNHLEQLKNEERIEGVDRAMRALNL